MSLVKQKQKQTQQEIRSERRQRRQQEIAMLLTEEYNSGSTILEKKKLPLMQLVAKSRQGKYSDEEIGKMFRAIFEEY